METENNSLRGVIQRFRKTFIKEQIKRHQKKTKCYWPELHLYCGICDLRTGLYIRSVISVLMYIVILVINVLMLYHLLVTGASLAAMEISDIEEYLGVNFTDIKIVKVKMIFTVLISYMVFWIVFKFIYIAAVFCTIYAIYKKKPKILKRVFYISVINWLLDVFILAFGALLLQILWNTMVVICILFEGYNLMALSSEYKQMRGKSKLLMNMNNDLGMETVTVSSPSYSNHSEDNDVHVAENRKHCESCTCINEATDSIPDPTTGTITNEVISDPNQTLESEPETEKVPNIKDVEIIFNQNMLATGQSPILETPLYVPSVNDTLVNRMNEHRAVRPRTLQLRPCSEEKIDIVDTPTIYDENQLNVGRSPVVEDNLNPLPPQYKDYILSIKCF